MRIIPGPLGREPNPAKAARLRRIGGWLPVAEEAARRMFDFGFALFLILALLPLMIARALYALLTAGRVFDRTDLVGRDRGHFEKLEFAGNVAGRGLAGLFNVVRGDLAFAGPRPITSQEESAIPPQSYVRFAIRPGLISAYRLRKRIGIAYESEHEQDRDFYYAQSLGGDLGLIARSIPSLLLGNDKGRSVPPTLSIFGITICNATMDEAIDWIVAESNTSGPRQLCFINADSLNIAYRNQDYKRVLNKADVVLPDGIGIHLAGRIKGTPLRENVNGTDLFPRLCERMAQRGGSLFLLGARPGIAEAAGHAMAEWFPGLKIAGSCDGYFTEAETPGVIAQINASRADILMVALGVPRQELWLYQHQEKLNIPMRIGVGGLFDYYSGRIPRAPIWMREIGLEWIWRIIQEPGRLWRRYLVGNPLFLFRVWREGSTAAPASAIETQVVE